MSEKQILKFPITLISQEINDRSYAWGKGNCITLLKFVERDVKNISGSLRYGYPFAWPEIAAFIKIIENRTNSNCVFLSIVKDGNAIDEEQIDNTTRYVFPLHSKHNAMLPGCIFEASSGELGFGDGDMIIAFDLLKHG